MLRSFKYFEIFLTEQSPGPETLSKLCVWTNESRAQNQLNLYNCLLTCHTIVKSWSERIEMCLSNLSDLIIMKQLKNHICPFVYLLVSHKAKPHDNQETRKKFIYDVITTPGFVPIGSKIFHSFSFKPSCHLWLK